MAEHLIKLWIRSEEDPSEIDWQACLPKGTRVEHAEVSSFPWAGVEHVITWWITRPLSAKEKILGHWEDARVHVNGGNLFIDIPAKLIALVEADRPGRGVRFGYQLLIERYRIVDLVQGRPRRRGSYIGECTECGAQAGLHALSCSRFSGPNRAAERAESPRPLTEAALAELRALPPSMWKGWPPSDYDQGLPVVEIRQDHLRALLAEVEERRRD